MADAEDGDGELARRAGDARVVQRLFDDLPLMLVGLEGPEHRVMAATKMYRLYVGREELVGVPLREAFPEAVGQQVFDIFDRVYATGTTEQLREFRIQIERPDLRQWVETFVDFTACPWLAGDGIVRGIIVHLTDVTERARERQSAQTQAAEAQRRYERARDIIDALQRELLPAGLPVLPELEVAAAYLLADADTAAGGDWFDALALGDGRVALIVGDVVGHGMAAAATMGQLSVVLRERLAASGDIVTALDALNAAAAWIPGAQAATVCVMLLDPAGGVFSYCTAGHPPPLVLRPGDEGRFLPATGARPLGVAGGDFTGEHVRAGQLDRGATVLLYTDGILERPGRTLTQATVELAQAAADVAADRAFRDELPPAERVCVHTLELLTRVTGHSDDITLLAGHRVAPSASLRLQLPAQTEELAPLRGQLGNWLAASGAGTADGGAVRHAVLELATNCVVHAYLGDSGDGRDFTVTAELDVTGQLEVRVSDHGTWREARPSDHSGYGLQMAAGLVGSLQLTHDDRGTTATVRHALTRPARLLTAEELPSGPAVRQPVQADPLLVLDQPWAPQPRVRVDGPLDAATAGEAERAVRAAGAAGAQDLTVDLTGVTHLGSAAVAALHRLDAEHRAGNTALQLYAPAGSPADMILTLVGLPHLTTDPHSPPLPGTARWPAV